MIIHNLKELKDYGTLKHKGQLHFILKKEILKYSVNRDHLASKGHIHNSEIFKKLHLDKYQETKDSYKYFPSIGDWPESKWEDYIVLTRLVEKLYKKIKNKDYEPILSKFDILDL